MRQLAEYAFFLGGSILLWAKLGSIALSLAVLLYGCYRFNKFLARTRLLHTTTTQS